MLNRLDILKIFAAAAAAPTFREAAARLGVSPQVVTRAVRDLEEMLGETLFHRTTRSIRITAFGQAFARDAQTALAAVDGLFGPATGQADDLLTVRVHVDAERLRALDPDVDLDGVVEAAAALQRTCEGEGPAGETTLGQRFRWLTAPRSTVVHAGPVHSGLTTDPAAEVERLVQLLVR